MSSTNKVLKWDRFSSTNILSAEKTLSLVQEDTGVAKTRTANAKRFGNFIRCSYQYLTTQDSSARNSFLVRATESGGAMLYFETSSTVRFCFGTLSAHMNASKGLFFLPTLRSSNESLPRLLDDMKTSLSLLSDSSISTVLDAFYVTFTRSFCFRIIFRVNSSAFDRRLRRLMGSKMNSISRKIGFR